MHAYDAFERLRFANDTQNIPSFAWFVSNQYEDGKVIISSWNLYEKMGLAMRFWYFNAYPDIVVILPQNRKILRGAQGHLVLFQTLPAALDVKYYKIRSVSASMMLRWECAGECAWNSYTSKLNPLSKLTIV